MRWQMLIASALAFSPALCYTLPSRMAPETIQVIGGADESMAHAHVQMLYDLLGGTFMLPMEGANGQNVTISAVHLARNDSIDIHHRARSFNIGARAPTFAVVGRSCVDPPQFGDRLLTYEQRRFIDGKFCSFLANAQPVFYSLVGLTVSNLKCGVNFKYTCQGFWTVSSALAGQFIGPGIQANCDASLEDLDFACPEKGGQQQVQINGGSKFVEEAFATTESGDICHANPNEGGEECSTYTCHGECNPGGNTP